MAQLITSPQTLTGSWVALGAPVDMTTSTRCAIWLGIDINNSNNARVRALPLLAKNSGTDYSLPIRTVGSSDVKVEEEFYEFAVDQDQEILLEIRTRGLVPYLQFEVQAGTVGAPAGEISTADVTLSTY
jgi:hypothetical protein|tara:strand:- start:8470 stop:8856 length:387 start_codon:yes stop_codon:yes gene_type:complete